MLLDALLADLAEYHAWVLGLSAARAANRASFGAHPARALGHAVQHLPAKHKSHEPFLVRDLSAWSSWNSSWWAVQLCWSVWVSAVASTGFYGFVHSLFHSQSPICLSHRDGW